MKVKRLHLQNYGRFEDLNIDFAPTAEKTSNVTVIVGNNGAGKSQILQALATSFGLFIESYRDRKQDWSMRSMSRTTTIPIRFFREDQVITLKTVVDNGFQNLESINSENEISWSTLYSVDSEHNENGNLKPFGIDMSELDLVIDSYNHLDQKGLKYKLPLIVFYPTERVVMGKNLDFNHTTQYSQLSAYKNSLNASIDFDDFFSWFRYREDIENAEVRKAFDILIQNIKYEEQSQSKEVLVSKVLGLISKDNSINEKKDTQLRSTIHAISIFLNNFNDVWIDRATEPPTMNVLKDNKVFSLNQLSQGEKSLLALVGDIARRLALLNPSLTNPLEGEGVVMIDEVDLHLHPKWQHDLIDKLVATFPNVQFILTTHSPHVISDRNDILLYSLDDGELTEMPNVYGEDANTVLTKIFDVDIRDSKVEEQFNVIRRAISKHDYMTAENCITELAEKLPSDHLELLKCRLLLAQSKLANNHKDESNHAED
ncbi:AAA family ATPase [Psychrobacter sp. T6-5]|uniref:AAA family ATPase n=1 Tax=Psychrobacter sp. T6-5 TaxID=3457451 RepID=UPI003FD36870